MSRTAYKKFEEAVLKKYFKNGIFTTFKGKYEMKVAQAKFVARRELEDLLSSIQKKEMELRKIEEDLSQARVSAQSNSFYLTEY